MTLGERQGRLWGPGSTDDAYEPMLDLSDGLDRGRGHAQYFVKIVAWAAACDLMRIDCNVSAGPCFLTSSFLLDGRICRIQPIQIVDPLLDIVKALVSDIRRLNGAPSGIPSQNEGKVS